MVRFEEKKLVIEIKAHCKNDALERWMDIKSAICDVLRNVNGDNICNTFCALPDFLQELMPDWDVAKRMVDNIKNTQEYEHTNL